MEQVTRAQQIARAREVGEELVRPGALVLTPVVGLIEITRMFAVKKHTPSMWRQRYILPEQDGAISGNPVWKLPTIYQFAEDTGRRIVWDPWGLVAPDGSGEATGGDVDEA